MTLPEFDALLFDPALFDTSEPASLALTEFFEVPVQGRRFVVPADDRDLTIASQTRHFAADSEP